MKPTDIEIIREIESVTKRQQQEIEGFRSSRQSESFTLEDELMETVKAAQMRANSSETPQIS